MAALSVFRGGWSLAAAGEVCQLNDAAGTMERLLDASLLYRVDTSGLPRFRMLETVREYAHRLLTPEESLAYRKRHLSWVLRRSMAISGFRVDDNSLGDLHDLCREHENVREAAHFALDTDAQAAFRLAANLYPLWHYRSSGFEGIQYYREVFSRYVEHPVTSDFVEASVGHALLAHFLQTPDRFEVYERALEWGQQVGLRRFEPLVLTLMAFYGQITMRYDIEARMLPLVEVAMNLPGAEE